MAKQEYMTTVYRAVGARIAAARRGAGTGITQQQLADSTKGGLSRSAIANIERGRQRLAVHQLYLIAKALQLDPGALLPPLELVLGAAEQLPQDPNVRDWLERIARKPLGKEMKSDAKTRSD